MSMFGLLLCISIVLLLPYEVTSTQIKYNTGIAEPVTEMAPVSPPRESLDESRSNACGCGKNSHNSRHLRANGQSFLEVNCEGINCDCEEELAAFEQYSRRQSESHRPDGRCYFHVANFIDAMGYGGISKNGFNNCVGSQYHQYAYQFHSAIGSGKCGLKNVKDKYNNNPYDAPRGALVVVSAGTPGTAHPVAGDIAVASGDGKFWNGGNMAYGGREYNYNGKLLAIYVPESCDGSKSSDNVDNGNSVEDQDERHDTESTSVPNFSRDATTDDASSSTVTVPEEDPHKECQNCIKYGGGKACSNKCPPGPCRVCIEHMGGKACAARCV